MPLLHGGSRRRGPMFFEHEGNRAVIDGEWKLVSDHPGPWELYDLEADRTELQDLAAREPRRVAAMREMYHRYAEETGVEAWPWVSPGRRRLILGALLLPVAVAAIWRWRRRSARDGSPSQGVNPGIIAA